MATTSKAIKNNLYWTLFEDAEFVIRVNALPDDRLLSTAEAAVFLDVSPATLERWSSDGYGPVPKRQGKGPTAPRMYSKGDLLAFQKKSGSPLGALHLKHRKVRRFTTISNLAEQLPYYIDEFGCVAGLVGRQPLGVVIDRLGAWEFVWLNAIEAVSRAWTTLEEHRNFSTEVSEVLAHSQQSIPAGLEATGIALETKTPLAIHEEEGLPLPKRKRWPPF